MSDNPPENMNTDAPAADAGAPGLETTTPMETTQQPPADALRADVPAESVPATIVDSAVEATDVPGLDTEMGEAPAVENAASSPAPAANLASSNAPSPAPARNSTPGRAVNGAQEPTSSRANSVHPETSTGTTIPARAADHGAPVRQYLNNKVTQALIDGMKKIAKEQPEDPLRVLGNYLLARADETEKTGSA